MSLDVLANQIASKGRHGDSTLVHFNPEELQGLHALARATGAKSGLTINPETGLYEAFSLKKLFKSVLPTILGVAANFIVPGSGLLVGALTGAATNKDNRLLGAILGGVGAYGGQQLVAGLNAAGSGVLAGEAAKAAGASAAQVTAETAAAQAGQAAAQSGANFFAGSSPSWANVSAGLGSLNPFGAAGLSGAQSGWSNLLGSAATPGAAGAPATGLGGLGSAATTTMQAAAPLLTMEPEQESYGAMDIATNPGIKDPKAKKYKFNWNPTGALAQGSAERNYFAPAFELLPDDTPPVTAATGGSLAALEYLQRRGPSSGDAHGAAEYLQGRGQVARHAVPVRRPTAEQINALRPNTAGGAAAAPAPAAPAPAPVAPPVYYGNPNSGLDSGYYGGTPIDSEHPKAGWSGDYVSPRWAAQNGAAAGGVVEDVPLQSGGFVFPADVVSAVGAGSSGAGIEALAKRFGAKPISGKGHGQSDDIPATIDGKTKARVARDEMYLDAEQVAKIGGGDPKKGAKKLYDVMTRVRKQATGSPKQMRAINVNSALR